MKPLINNKYKLRKIRIVAMVIAGIINLIDLSIASYDDDKIQFVICMKTKCVLLFKNQTLLRIPT